MDKPISVPRRQGCIYFPQEALKSYTVLGGGGAVNPNAEKGSKYVGIRGQLSPEIPIIHKSVHEKEQPKLQKMQINKRVISGADGETLF